MLKKAIIAVVVIFLVWSGLDMVIHGMILQPTYEATASLWRPMDQMNMPLMYFVTLVTSIGIVALYTLLVAEKSLVAGVKLGVLLGVTVAVPMGFGSYSYMPIPLNLAWGWFLGGFVEFAVAGAIAGAIVKS